MPHRLCKLIDVLLQPFLNKIKSYIRDGIHLFKLHITNKLILDTLVVTFDITNLYSNITYKLGKQAISFWIEKYRETLHPRFNKTFITDSRELILNNNYFQFNNINYIQTLETAIGTKMAPTYTTLILAYLEENLYEIIGQKYNNIKNRIY